MAIKLLLTYIKVVKFSVGVNKILILSQLYNRLLKVVDIKYLNQWLKIVIEQIIYQWTIWAKVSGVYFGTKYTKFKELHYTNSTHAQHNFFLRTLIYNVIVILNIQICWIFSTHIVVPVFGSKSRIHRITLIMFFKIQEEEICKKCIPNTFFNDILIVIFIYITMPNLF